MKRSQTALGLGLVVLLIAVGGGVLLAKQHADREARVEALLGAARIELDRSPPDRGAIHGVIRTVTQAGEVATDPRVVRTRARLLLVLERYQDAWDAIRGQALVPEPEIEDVGLAARVLFAWHGLRGDPEHLNRAMTFGRRHYEATGDVGSLLLAWQAASRGGRTDARDELALRLGRDHPDSSAGRLVRALAADPPTSVAELVDLASEFEEEVPAELDFEIARRQLDEGGSIALALQRLERVLRAYPADVATRNVAVVAYHKARNRVLRDEHLKWLLANAPKDDARRVMWEQMLEAPVRAR